LLVKYEIKANSSIAIDDLLKINNITLPIASFRRIGNSRAGGPRIDWLDD